MIEIDREQKGLILIFHLSDLISDFLHLPLFKQKH